MNPTYTACLAQRDNESFVGSVDDCLDAAMQQHPGAHRAYAVVNCAARHASEALKHELECSPYLSRSQAGDARKGQLIERGWRQSFLENAAFDFRGRCRIEDPNFDACNARWAATALFERMPIPIGH